MYLSILIHVVAALTDTEGYMKYIVFKRTWYSFIQEVPIIFPIELNHREVFESVKNVDGMEDAVLVSAGFLNLLQAPHCFGNSDSLARMLHKSSLISNCRLAGIFRQRRAEQPLPAEADG